MKEPPRNIRDWLKGLIYERSLSCLKKANMSWEVLRQDTTGFVSLLGFLLHIKIERYNRKRGKGRRFTRGSVHSIVFTYSLTLSNSLNPTTNSSQGKRDSFYRPDSSRDIRTLTH